MIFISQNLSNQIINIPIPNLKIIAFNKREVRERKKIVNMITMNISYKIFCKIAKIVFKIFKEDIKNQNC